MCADMILLRSAYGYGKVITVVVAAVHSYMYLLGWSSTFICSCPDISHGITGYGDS